MELTQFDIGVLVIMPLAIISMAFVFPSLGLTAADPGENEIPQFDMESDRFDLAGEAPRKPAAPGQGSVWLNDSKNAQLSQNRVWLDGDTQDGEEIVLIGSNEGQLTVNNWTAGTAVSQTFNLTSEGQQFVYDDNEYVIAFTVEEYRPSESYYEVSYELREQPDDTATWIRRVPVLGSAFTAAGYTAQLVGWIGAILFYAAIFVVELAVNMLGMLFDVVSFLFNLQAWLVNTYADIINGAQGFVTVFILIPGILLSLILAKVVLIGVSLLPTT